jgi:hypothetical protein
MKLKQFLIITASDSKYGNFLIDHWLKSLKRNIVLEKVDIAVLDYGLDSLQRKKLKSQKIILVRCIRNGHITNIRYRDMVKFLKKRKYKQILTCDSGDIIFQTNIMPIFYSNNSNFRAIQENMKDSPFVKRILKGNSIEQDIKLDILDKENNSPMINGGFILGPYHKFLKLCIFVSKKIIAVDTFALDQPLVNHYLLSEGYINLGENFNFIPSMSIKNFFIKNGVFLDNNRKPFAVVHNTGGSEIFRIIGNFGFGIKFNQIKWFKYYLGRIYRRINEAI